MDLLFFQSFWFLVIGGFLFVFAALDGFDLGVGMLNPFWTKAPEHKSFAIHSIWPVWDGNELWGLLAGGALLTIFPLVFNLLLTAFYPFIILLLVALIYRPISFEIWFHNEKARPFWQTVFALCSFAIPVLMGTVLGNTLYGLDLKADHNYGGSLLALLNPFSLLTGLAFTTAMILHGAAWLVVKMEGAAQEEARVALKRSWLVHLVVGALWLLAVFFLLEGAAAKPLVIAAALLLLVDLVVLRLLAGTSAEKRIFLLSTLGLGFFMALVGAYQFPVLVRASNDPALSLTITNASAPFSTLQFLGFVGPIGLLAAAGYSVYVYRVFKGKMKQSGSSY